MEGPLELTEGDRQPTEGDIALGTRVAQALGFSGKVRRERGEQLGLPPQRRRPVTGGPGGCEIKCFAQFQAQTAVFDAREANEKDLGGLAAEVGTFRGGDELEASFFCGRVNCGGKRSFRSH